MLYEVITLEVVRHPVGVLKEELATDDDVEVHVFFRAGPARSQFVIADDERLMAFDDAPDFLHRFGRKTA